MSDKTTRGKKLQARYQLARAAGFNSSEANKMKHWSEARINNAIKDKEKAEKAEKARVKRNEQRRENYRKLREYGYTPNEARKYKSSGTERMKFLTQDIKYIPPNEMIKKFLSDYTYLLSYKTKDKDGNIMEKFIYITSTKKMNPAQIKQEAIEKVFENEANSSIYEGAAVLYHTIQIERAFTNA